LHNVEKSFLLKNLFPEVKINKVKGKYKVGIIDLHMPVENFEHEHVTVRLLYPTLEKSVRVPYFDVENGPRICKALMKVGAPPPLNKLGFMLNHWRLSTVDGKRNATPHVPAAPNDENEKDGDESSGKEENPKLPIAIYSHGLTGSAELYSYQTMSLAASGTFVMSITHSDASAIDVTRRDGSFISYDPKISQLSDKKETFEESVRQRRWQVDYRARELLAAADALTKLNERNADELKELGVSFVDKLNLKDIIVLGHSFGGATAINAAHMRPNMFMCCIAHDPAIDWCTDDCRKALFSKDRFIGSDLKYEGGTGGLNGYEVDDVQSPIQDIDLFLLYSHQWARFGWGHYNYLRDLFKRGQIGRKNGPTDVSYVYNANHSEFSDSCMKLPLWLSRAVGVTGKRNPHETAFEIFDRTSTFISEVHKKRATKSKSD
jgi:pimeloyl-ACP methyl ester carboxylesterase